MAVTRPAVAMLRTVVAATLAAAALVMMPVAAVASPAPAPHFTCRWSAAAAPLCLAYDAQSLVDAFGGRDLIERGYVATVTPGNLGPDAGRPGYAVFVHGNFITAPDTEAVTGWIVAFLERANGQVRAIAGPGVEHLSTVIPPGAGPVHALAPPPPWEPACAVRAFAIARRTFAPRLARARAQLAHARTPSARRRGRAVLGRLVREAAAYPNTVGRRTCTPLPATTTTQPPAPPAPPSPPAGEGPVLSALPASLLLGMTFSAPRVTPPAIDQAHAEHAARGNSPFGDGDVIASQLAHCTRPPTVGFAFDLDCWLVRFSGPSDQHRVTILDAASGAFLMAAED